jgi:hypothetical protein
MAILYSIAYFLASVLGVVAVAIAASFDYLAWGFVGPLAIMTAVVVLSGIFGSEVEGRICSGWCRGQRRC